MKKVCAGIVTYNPNPELFIQCLNSIKKQVEKVYIFDNGSTNENFLNNLVENLEYVSVIYNGKNSGIAKALNELCKIAEKEGFGWIVTMDQDSICADDMVKKLYDYTDNLKYGIIAPSVEFKSDGKLIHETKNMSNEVEEIRACITSGSLTQIAAWKKIGGFDEWMFIDHVDNEFCTHLYIEGYFIIRVNSALLYQRAGEMKYLSLPGGKKILLPYYSELRNYYICRNTIYYLRKYKKYINYKHELLAFLYSQMVKITFEGDRWTSIKSTFIGIRDGMINKVIWQRYC